MRPDGLYDMRSRAGREAEILAEIAIDGALSVAWLQANRLRQAALVRLVAAGKLRRLPSKYPDVVRFEAARPAPEGFWARIVRRFIGETSV